MSSRWCCRGKARTDRTSHATPTLISQILHKQIRLGFGALTVLLTLAASGAFAYWTSSAEGSGEVETSHTGASFEVTSSVVESLAPGRSVPVTVTVKDTGEQSGFLTRLQVEVQGTSAAGCKAEWFEVTPSVVEPSVLVVHGALREYVVSLKMREEATINQSACNGATVTLHYKAS